MRLGAVIVLAALVCLALAKFADISSLSVWATEAQRGFQNQMADAIHGLQIGETGALLALLSATLAYGFVHALGPGHGKYLVGGVGLGTSISTARLLTLAISSSLLQALWAIVLVYGGLFLVETSARGISALADDVLTPASYVAIACVGLSLVWRGTRSMLNASKSHDDPSHAACCGHSHGPTAAQIADVKSLRQAMLLVLSIAIRPCTGAVFLLVIAWQMDIKIQGAVAVLVMGSGTAALTGLVAVSSVVARTAAFASFGAQTGLQIVFPILQISTGTIIAIISVSLLGF